MNALWKCIVTHILIKPDSPAMYEKSVYCSEVISTIGLRATSDSTEGSTISM